MFPIHNIWVLMDAREDRLSAVFQRRSSDAEPAFIILLVFTSAGLWRRPCNHLGIMQTSLRGLSQCILLLLPLADAWKVFQAWICRSQMPWSWIRSSDWKPLANSMLKRENNPRGQVLQDIPHPPCEAGVAHKGYRSLPVTGTCCECC